ncbi:hypothetical protein ACFSKM_17080 [Ancylobacter dichloromethanicus]
MLAIPELGEPLAQLGKQVRVVVNEQDTCHIDLICNHHQPAMHHFPAAENITPGKHPANVTLPFAVDVE